MESRMSIDDSTGTGMPRSLLIGLIVVVLAVGGLVAYLMTAGPSRPPTSPGDLRSTNQAGQENALEQARESLGRANDLATCRSAIQQINTYLTEKNERRPPQLTSEAASQLQEKVGLRPDEVKEIEGSNYTLLDAHHLDRCFLFQDVAAALALGTVGNDKNGKPIQRTALERARAAFAWVAREVRQFGGADARLFEGGAPPVPPEFVVRRGVGSALERALVFLALLQGFREEEAGLHGCLLTIRDKDNGPARLWACGVLAEGGADIFLFDPASGTSIPGKDCKGVATLAGLRKDPGLFGQLQFGEAARYDVNAAQVAGAEVSLVFSLSALSPRMHYLQEDLLPPMVRVKLAEDPAAELARWNAAVANLDMKAPKVAAWKDGTSLARQFLPEAEGGVDQPQPFPLRLLGGFTTPDDPEVVPMTRRQVFERTLVPWPAFPGLFRDKSRFPYSIRLGRAVREAFAQPFVRSALEPGHVRDMQLRGQYLKAAELLVQERGTLQRQEGELRARGADLSGEVHQWVNRATSVYANQLRAENAADRTVANQQVIDLWKKSDAVQVLLGGAIAQQRGVGVTFLLGLCKHEEAARLQARLDVRARADLKPSTQEAAAARVAWKTAANWWRRYLEEYATGSGAPQVRRLLAEALAHTGEQTEAVALLEDLSGPMTPQEKVAHLVLAKQLKEVTK